MSAPRMTTRDLSKNSTVRDELPIPEPFTLGQYVRLEGRHGLFKVKGANRDGSLLLFGGTKMSQAYRAAEVSRVRAATKSEIRKAGLS